MQVSKPAIFDWLSYRQTFVRWRPEIGVLAVGLFFYSFQLGHESLWIDEILSIGSAEGRLDFNRPLYFVLLRFWLRVGEGEAWLRSLSVLFGLGSLGLTYQLGRQLVSRKVGLIAALLFALSPLAIGQAQEVRFYMMSLCFGVGGSLALAGALQEKSKRGAIALWIICRTLGFLTAQPNALLLVPDTAIIAGALFLCQPQTLSKATQQTSRWLWALGFIAIPMAVILKDVVPPLIEFLLTQKWYAGAAQPPTLSNFIGMMATLTAWPLQGPASLGMGFFFTHLFNLYAVAMLGVLLFALVSFLRQGSKQRNVAMSLALWGLMPVALVFAMSQFFSFLWLERYCAIAIPYITILLAAGGVQLWQQRRAIAVLAAILYLVAVSGPLVRYYTTDYHANWRGLAQEIEQDEIAQDVVMVYPGSFMPYIDYYYDGEAAFLPVEDTDNYQDVNVERLVSEVSALERFWLVCPIKEQWQTVRDELTERLKAAGYSEQQASQQIDHQNWGPTLTLFSKRSN